VADADGPPGGLPPASLPPTTLPPTSLPPTSLPPASLPTTRSFGAPVSDPGTVHVFLGAERTRIVLAGEIDAELGTVLHEASAAAERARLPIEVDTHHVTFMDSSGVAFLARLSTRSSTPVRLLRVPPSVGFLLEVTRIGELLDVVPDELPPEPQKP